MSSGGGSQTSSSDFKQEKLSTLQKNLLVRWINTLDVCENYLTLENIVEELKSGILLCNILKFHQPNLDFTGVNPKARAKKQCLNNIERALSILYQKGAAPRYIPTADEIFEGDKYADKIWILLRTIFDVFAMHDVGLLLQKIVKWINKSLSYFPGRESVTGNPDEIYQDFKTGVNLACILYLYGPQDNEDFLPDFRMIYEHPQNRQEVMNNLSYIFNLAIKNNVPIYLKPAEYLDFDQHNFLLLQLYYLYCKFKNSKPSFSRRSDPPPQLIFKDEGRILEDNSQTSGGQSSNATPQHNISPGSGGLMNLQTAGTHGQGASQIPVNIMNEQYSEGEQQRTHTTNSMGVIDEVDSVEFSSTMKSSQKHDKYAGGGVPAVSQQQHKRQQQEYSNINRPQSANHQNKASLGIQEQSFSRGGGVQPPQIATQAQGRFTGNRQQQQYEDEGNVDDYGEDMGEGDDDQDYADEEAKEEEEEEEDIITGSNPNPSMGQKFNKVNNSGGRLQKPPTPKQMQQLSMQKSFEGALKASQSSGLTTQNANKMRTQSQNSANTVSAGGSQNGGTSKKLQSQSNYEQNQQQNTSINKVDQSLRQYHAIVDENIGIFNSRIEDQTLNGSPQQPNHLKNASNGSIMRQMKPELFIEERKALFMEDLRGQLSRLPKAATINQGRIQAVTEDQLQQMYYSSVGGMTINQTAQFTNNFNTIDQALPSTSTHLHPQISSSDQTAANNQRQQLLIRFRDITDENGDLDEHKCLSLLMTPQLALVQNMQNSGQQIKVFISLKPAETFYSELSEGYTLRVQELPISSKDLQQQGKRPRILHDIKLGFIESILMKNIVQKQFVVAWTNQTPFSNSGAQNSNDNLSQMKQRLVIEMIDRSDQFFQALSFIFQKHAAVAKQRLQY